MNINGLNIHACFLDRECLQDWWRYGMPLRLYVGEKMFDVPGFSGRWRSSRVWRDAVELERNPFAKEVQDDGDPTDQS